MNLALALIGLIISIMTLNGKKTFLLIKLILTCIIATKTYIIFFGEYYLWKDKDWYDENIYGFFNNGQFFRCIISVIITYGFFHYLIPFLIRLVIRNIKPKYDYNKYDSFFNNPKFKNKIAEYLYKKTINTLKHTRRKTIEIYDKEKMDYKTVLMTLSKILAIVTELIIVWIIIMPKMVLWEYIVYLIFCVIIVCFMIIMPSIESYYNYIIANKNEQNNEPTGDKQQIPDRT